MKRNRIFSLAIVALFTTLALPVGLAAQQHHQYKLIDLGSFGGPGGGIVNPSSRALNNQGTIVGVSDTANADPYPNTPFYDGQVDRTLVWSNGRQTELPPLPGGKNLSNIASSINKEGWIVGQAQNGEIDQATGWPVAHGALWRGATSVTDLGSLGGTQGIANAINDFGQVVGGSATNIPDTFYNYPLPLCIHSLGGCGSNFSIDALFFPVTTEVHAFLWQGGHMHDLGTLSGPDGSGTDSTAWIINNLGEVAGWSFTANAATVEPFFWSPADGKMISLGSLGGHFGEAWFMNNRGQVVGASNPAGDQTEHPFIWSKSTGMKDLFANGGIGGNYGHADWINDAGEVVGLATITGNRGNTGHGFLWKNGVMTDLGAITVGPRAWPGTEAFSINSVGQIVGGTAGKDVYGFLWENGGPMVDLNTLVANGSDLTVVQALVINDSGEIACNGQLPNGDTHPCVLIPCDRNHPNVEGCNYSLVDVSATALETSPASAVQVPATGNAVANATMFSRRATGSRPVVTWSPASLTFSFQMLDTTSPAQTISLKNTGGASLTIDSIVIAGTDAGDFAQTHTCGTFLRAGESCSISVTFKPTSSGTRTAELSIGDNAAGSPQSVALTGSETTAFCAGAGVQCGRLRCWPGLTCQVFATSGICE